MVDDDDAAAKVGRSIVQASSHSREASIAVIRVEKPLELAPRRTRAFRDSLP